MSKELVISANRHETKVAILEEDQLVEIYFQHSNEYSLAGSIHKGRVTRVLPGMQSAFVDLGLERDTFLYVSDFFEESEEYDRIPAGPERGSRSDDRTPRKDERSPRVDRSDRPERAERVEVLSQEARPPLAATESVPPVSPSSSLETEAGSATLASAAATSSFQRTAEDRDQAGRRSRRRRNRGRGFPDSKYASEGDTSPAIDQDRVADVTRSDAARTAPEAASRPSSSNQVYAVSEPEASNNALIDYEFPVLPGETLAKYRQPRATAFVDEPAAPPQVSIPVSPEPETSERERFASGGAAPAPERAEVPESSAPHWEDQPEAIAVSEIIAEAREGSFTVEEVADSQQPSAALLASSELDSSVVDNSVLDNSSIESPEADLAPSDEAGETSHYAGQIAGAEPLEDTALPESSPDKQPEAEAGSEQLSANVREQGGRYMHRMPRRMRRKMRGDGRPGPEGRPASEGRTSAVQQSEHEPAATVAPSLAPRQQEPRTVARPEKTSTTPSITDLLREGQEILVQIAKEPLGQKGARITSHIALPGRYVVYMPTLEHMGVSRKVGSDEERLRLKRILQTHSAGMTGGFIVRTAGEGKPEDEIAADMSFLFNLWVDIRQKAEKRPAPLLLHHDLDIVQRILRDQFTDNFKAIWVDNEELYESVLRFVQRFHAPLVGRVKLYTRSAPIFDAFNVTPELEKALRPKVWLKSGGYIVINQTEALVAIDVNTGKYVGKSNRLEDTIVKTNTEAVNEIVRQIRLRDLGGIIVVDFIDMDERKNRQKVMQALEEAMRADKAPNKILQFNDFGLVAITRKRVKQSLERALCSPCPYCEGAGYVKSLQTTVSDILQEAHKIAPALEGKDVILRVHPDLAKYLKSHQNKYLEELEETLRRPVMVKADPSLHHEKFDLA
ncbi:MAG: Rne/Rng family ribonuclease [Acidobacteriota bacterium]|nr:Rne/Rng family ribonuclease [Acidobacteriota bacterium]